MAYGDYYNPSNKIVNSGDIVYADDLNAINSAVEAGFAQVASDLDTISIGDAATSKAWATGNQGVRPDILLDAYSSKANALEAKDWASASGLITAASTGTTIPGSKSAKTSATEAASSASSASGYASAASTQADVATTQASLASGYKDVANTAATTATTQAGIATTKATEASDWASKAVDSVVSGGLYSSRHYAQKAADTVASLGASLSSIASLTPSADKIPYYTGASTAALATITSAGRALLDDVDAAAQRVTLGLGNVPNLDCTNANNLTSGTVADARIASTITRDSEVNTATTVALALKANLSSPALTGVPSAPTAPSGTNTTQLATTEFVVGQRGVNNPAVDGIAAVGTSYLYAREDHVHPSDPSKANTDSPIFTGTPVAPTAAYNTNTTQIATTAFVASAVASKASISSPVFSGIPTVPLASGSNTSQIANVQYILNSLSSVRDGEAIGDLGNGAYFWNAMSLRWVTITIAAGIASGTATFAQAFTTAVYFASAMCMSHNLFIEIVPTLTGATLTKVTPTSAGTYILFAFGK